MKKILLLTTLTALLLTIFAVSAFAIDASGNIVVVLDPGHGGYDPGSILDEQHNERGMTLAVALACKAELEAHGGFTVYLTRYDEDTYLDRYSRAKIADEYNADIMLSIHFDSFEEPYSYIRGASAYASVIDRYDASELGTLILQNLERELSIPMRSVFRKEDYGANTYYWSPTYNFAIKHASWLTQKADWYGILLWSSTFSVPSLIVEHAFLTNPEDKAILLSDGAFEKLGKADAAAIIEYYSHEHVFSAELETDYPTSCCFQGKASYRCSICACRKNTVSLTASSDAHIYLQSGSQAASCTENGYIDYICGVTELLNSTGKDQFGYHTHREVIPAIGHSYINSTDQSGNPCQVCEHCGDVVYSVPPSTESPSSSSASSDSEPSSESNSETEMESGSASQVPPPTAAPSEPTSSDSVQEAPSGAPISSTALALILIALAFIITACFIVLTKALTKPKSKKR